MWEDYFYYDETSKSCLRWAKDRYNGRPAKVFVHKGSEAGNLNQYYECNLEDERLMLHRVVWEIHHGPIPDGMIIDHIDGNKTNNKISNLRLVTHRTNSRNSGKRSHNKTGFTGVAKTVRNECGREYWYYTALWKTLEGKQRTANYSIEKLGDSAAFLMAITHRLAAMEDLAMNGAGYTERHGK